MTHRFHPPSIIRRLSAPLIPQATGMEPELTRLPNIKAVLVDIYGTVLISGSGDVGTASEHQPELEFAKALETHGLHCDERVARSGPQLIRDEIVKAQQMVCAQGIDVPEINILHIWETVLHQLYPDQEPIDVKPVALSYECRVNPVWPMPHAKQSLNRLKSDFQLGIVSNAQFYTPVIIETLLDNTLAGLGFDPQLCSWSWKELTAKPSTRLFEKPLQELRNCGIEPEETVYIGNDMLNDVWTARECGCKTILFAGDQRSLRMRETDSRCEGLTPDARITNWNQLPEILEMSYE